MSKNLSHKHCWKLMFFFLSNGSTFWFCNRDPLERIFVIDLFCLEDLVLEKHLSYYTLVDCTVFLGSVHRVEQRWLIQKLLTSKNCHDKSRAVDEICQLQEIYFFNCAWINLCAIGASKKTNASWKDRNYIE